MGLDLRVDQRDVTDQLRGLTAKHRYWVDLVSRRTGEVSWDSYGSGPSEALAIIATEQGWLVEQDGSGSTPGATYVEKGAGASPPRS